MLTLSLALLATVHKSNPGVTFLSKAFLPLSLPLSLFVFVFRRPSIVAPRWNSCASPLIP